jgi:hypothetical protein
MPVNKKVAFDTFEINMNLLSIFKAFIKKQTSGSYNLKDQKATPWHQRAIEASLMIRDYYNSTSPAHFHLVDLGCGDKKLFTNLEAAKLNFKYTGYDLLPQSADVHPLDLNQNVFHHDADMTAILGVLEYINDVPSLLKKLNTLSPAIVLSYVVSDSGCYNEAARSHMQWKNNYSVNEIMEIVRASGYTVTSNKMLDNDRTLLLLANKI